MASPQDAPANPLQPSASTSNLRASSQGPDAASSSRPTDAGESKEPSRDSQPHPTSDYLARPRPLVTTLGWDLNKIVGTSPNFHHVRRVHCTSPAAKPDVVIPELEENGTPLVISGWNRLSIWPRSLFTVDWLSKNGDQNPTVRNVHNWADVKMPIGDFIDKLRHSSVYASAGEQERFYGKDGECPAEWTKWLTSGAIPEQLLFDGSNDLLKFLPDTAKVQTLMCYMGVGDTFTPFHKDLCASSGQNLMCYTEHSGSAFWFMTKSSAAPQVATYFHQLGQEVDLETHVVTLEELAKAPFDVYIAEQQLGDLVLVPPRSCHQVVNKGGITIKTSWSRMSLSGLRTALWHELPIYHRVCRQEIYKVKSNIFHALRYFTTDVEKLPENTAPRADAILALQRLIEPFDDILASDFSTSRDSMPHVSQPGSSHMDNLHCDFCGADIFQSLFECVPCRTASTEDPSDSLPIGDGLVLCPSCYAEGRTCRCGVMEPVQCRPYSDLLQVRDRAVRAIQRIDVSYTNVYGCLSEQPNQLLSGRQVNTFEAACKLFQQRQSEAKTFRSCRARREQSHQVPATAAIYCKPCHGSRCYTHLLEGNCIHSVDAIILSERYNGSMDWHLFHSRGAKQYQELRRSIIEDEERGTRPNDASLRLVYLAKTFTTCRPVAPESTEHGWYDRYAQTTAVPIAVTPAKILLGLPDEFEGDELCDSHTEQHEPPSRQPSRSPITDLPVPAPTFSSPAGTNLIDNPTIADSPMHSPDHLQSGHPPLLRSPLVSRELPIVTSITSAPMDDPGNLSDLTDLPTEKDSSPRNLNTIMSGPGESNPQMTIKSPLSPPPAVSLTSSRSLGKPRFSSKFDGVEIQSASKRKRKRTQPTDVLTDSEPEQPPRRYPARQSAAGRRGDFNYFSSQTAGPSSRVLSSPSSSDSPPPTKRPALGQSSNKGKRKISRGAASRLPRSNEHTRTSPSTADPAPQANVLASALNQTFMHNSNAGHPTTIPPSNNSPPSVNNTNNVPHSEPQYVDAATQTKPHFTRRTHGTPPVDPLSTITQLQSENDKLQHELESWKGECALYSKRFDDLREQYALMSSQSYPPPTVGPSKSNIHTSSESTAHAGSRVHHLVTDNQTQSMHVQEPDFPPIETLALPTPSSGGTPGRLPESNALRLPSPTRRRTPTAPRSHRNPRAEGQGDHLPYHYGPRYFGRDNNSGETPRNGKKRRGKDRRGPVPSGKSERLNGSSTQPNPLAPTEAGPSNSLSVSMPAEGGGEAHSNGAVPPSAPSTTSDQTRS